MKKNRPDQAIYFPGSRKLSKLQMQDDTVSITVLEDDLITDSLMKNLTVASNAQKFMKKPDIAIYVPKKRTEYKGETFFDDNESMVSKSNDFGGKFDNEYSIQDNTSLITTQNSSKGQKSKTKNSRSQMNTNSRKVKSDIKAKDDIVVELKTKDLKPLMDDLRLTVKPIPLLSLDFKDSKGDNKINTSLNNSDYRQFKVSSTSAANAEHSKANILKTNNCFMQLENSMKNEKVEEIKDQIYENKIQPFEFINKEYKMNKNSEDSASPEIVKNRSLDIRAFKKDFSKNKNVCHSKVAYRDSRCETMDTKNEASLNKGNNIEKLCSNERVNNEIRDKNLQSSTKIISSKSEQKDARNFNADVASGKVGGIIRIPAGTSVNSVSEQRKPRENTRRLYDAYSEMSNPITNINKPQNDAAEYFNYEDKAVEAISTQLPVLEMSTGNYSSYIGNIFFLNDQLKKFLQTAFTETIFSNINYLRFEILQLCSYALFEELENTIQQNVQDLVWKSCFHQTIEWLKRNDCETLLPSLIKQGLYHFEKLLNELEANYNFPMDKNSKKKKVPTATLR